MRRPIVLVHGYSDEGESFRTWESVLTANGYEAEHVHLGHYVSLSNDVSIKDIAEGFDRALRTSPLLGGGEPFDAIVHSTGMLVVREWLAGTSGAAGSPDIARERQGRLRHLIGLAPATFGSPMAHKGRSWLGAMFKGRKALGPDFLEAGDQVLSGLELASAYTWDLAHRDFLAASPVYDTSSRTPYAFVFMGLDDYGFLKRAITEPGTDGTVRWAGAGFNVRKIRINLTQRDVAVRLRVDPWTNSHVPLVFLPGQNHGTILTEPSVDLQRMVLEALAVDDAAGYRRFAAAAEQSSAQALTAGKAKAWQQFIVHAVDERGDGIRDYFVQLGEVVQQRYRPLDRFSLDVHAYRDDPSYRSFHVDLDALAPERLQTLAIRIIASSGTELVGYQGFNDLDGVTLPSREVDKWDAWVAFDPDITGVRFFYPYTTTLVELVLNREPAPFEGPNRVFTFLA